MRYTHSPFELAIAAVLFLAAPCSANIDLSVDNKVHGPEPALFADHMVLQRDTNVPIWGKADPGETVSVTIAGQTKTTVTPDTGRWRVELDPVPAGGPYDMVVTGNNTITLTDVLFGEVWLCGGQSNMVLDSPPRSEMAVVPAVRALRFGDWSDPPGRVCWNFALAIHDALSVPVGIINNAKGGARIRTFLPPAVLTDPDPTVAEILKRYPIWGDLWAEVTEHLVPYAMRGVIWWQGESDSLEAENHRYILPALIRGWRKEWGRGDFPFIFVQLPNGKGLPFGDPVRRLRTVPSRSHPWPPVLRNAFFAGLAEPNTGMIVTSDLAGGIHPPPEVYPEYADRLANAARVLVYGESFLYSGPIFASAVAEGRNVRIRFRPNTADGLHSGAAPLQGFALSEDHQNWVWADATIEGAEVVVSSPEIGAPVAVRYGYGIRFKWANLYNSRNLVAGPFDADVQPAS